MGLSSISITHHYSKMPVGEDVGKADLLCEGIQISHKSSFFPHEPCWFLRIMALRMNTTGRVRVEFNSRYAQQQVHGPQHQHINKKPPWLKANCVHLGISK